MCFNLLCVGKSKSVKTQKKKKSGNFAIITVMCT